MAEIKRQLEAYDAAQVTKSTNQTTEQVAEAEPAHEDVIMDESADAEPRGSTSMVDDRDEVDEEMLVTEQALALAQTVSEAMRDAAVSLSFVTWSPSLMYWLGRRRQVSWSPKV